MKIRCLIVDDEPLAQDILETYVNKVPDLELVAKCPNAVEARQILKTEQIDLLFLDIQMPEITGLDFMRSLNHPPAVIFTTAYANYAVEGFNLNAVDYLLKPISFDRFLKAVNKVEDRISKGNPGNSREANANEPDDYVFVKTDKKMVKVKYKDIQYIEGLKDYVMIYTNEGRHVTLMTMKSLEEQLPDKLFKRIHKSYIISVDKINAVVGQMVEIDGAGKLIPVGNSYKEEFFKIIDEHHLNR
jgi:DNA-binding LytR/AlgR family response regulator